MSIFNQICLWIVIGITAAAAIHWLRRRYPAQGPAKQERREQEPGERGEAERGKTEKGLYPAALLILYGLIAIRSIGLGSIPGGFNQDGAMGAVDALALATYGTDRFGNWLPAHFRAWGFGQMSVLLSYLTVPFIRLWGLNAVTARLPMLLASIAGAGALYGLIRDMAGRRAAVITLLCVAVCPWHFMQSRWALDCNLFPHMFILGLFFLNKGLRKQRYLYLSMVFFALCMYAYGVSFYMVPVFLLVSCIVLLITHRVNGKQVLLAAVVYFGLSWPIYGTMLINFMGWETVCLPFTTMAYFPDSIRSNDIIFFSEQPFRQLLDNAVTLWRQVFLQRPDLIWNAIDDFGTVYLCSMPLVLAGAGITVLHAVREEKERRMPYILLLIYWGTS
ncbi:MAG: glycosyltransferase family 39 protein, partial [Lachnospiraceae bacterium]|nr:glycosyltransferase family 39 protein [Lachnospiraceae bacterium]